MNVLYRLATQAHPANLEIRFFLFNKKDWVVIKVILQKQ